jgi:serine/threonine protein kinase/peptidoglycan hydrolase-like protein with peptidoglycan-binding domain
MRSTPPSDTVAAGLQSGDPEHVEHGALQPGQAIGRYEIVSVLGQGGFGITYRARDVQLDREVAIKEYLPSALAIRAQDSTVLPRSTKMADDFGWGRERFVTEGRTLASLHRVPAIVQVFDFLQANGTAYIVMELLHGDTLENRIGSQGKLSAAEVDRILWPLLEGLERVHNAGFLHRDIKPANILLDAAGNPTLIDFGASRAAMAGRSTPLTAIFTPGYAAPEQMTSAKQGPWTDIYGLSATLYHAITGKAPPGAFDRILEDNYNSLVLVGPSGFSPGVLAGVDAGLAVTARDRPQTIAGWRPILAMSEAPTQDSTVVVGKAPAAKAPAAKDRHVPIVTPSPAARAPAGNRLALWIPLGAVVVALLGGGGYYGYTLWKDSQQQQQQQQQWAEQKRQAETAEKALQLSMLDRQHVQVALTAQGFDTGGSDGNFGPRTREALANWQKAHSDPPTGFVSGEQNQALLRDAAAAIATFDQAQKQQQQQAAEMAENALQLSTLDRQHVQVALTALGFATGATDGNFNPRTREALANWQKAHSHSPTGYLSGEQNQTLLRSAAAAVSNFDQEQLRRQRAAAEGVENALQLSMLDRQHVQVALNALGFDAGSTDGNFSARTREALANWQKAHNHPATGYLSREQNQALLHAAAPVIASFDQQQALQAKETVNGAFDHFGQNLMMIRVKDQPSEIRLQGVDVVADPALLKLGVDALAVQPRDLRCRQTDRLTDGTPLYRCLITKLNAKPPLANVPDAERDDLALALVRNGLVLASCDAPRSYADAEDDARARKASLWGRVNVPEYKRRCSK